MVEKPLKKIAIIGSGASGVACFIQLVLKHIIERQAEGLSILIFEKRNDFGEGLAFGTGQDGHLLNTKARLMGIFPKEQLHFVQWMHQNKEMIREEFPQTNLHPDAYPPRMLYGKYVRAMLTEYLELASKNGIEVKMEQAEVEKADITAANTLLLSTAGERTFKADYAILATGNPASGTFVSLDRHEGFFQSPWPSSRILSGIKSKDARIGIVGSSLTSIDALITLISNGHRGPITLFSLKGLLPRVQPYSEIPFDRKVLTMTNVRRLIRAYKRPLRLVDLIRMFRAEVESLLQKRIDWRAEERTDKDQLDLLEEDIRLVTEGESVLQTVLYSLRKDIYPLWQLLPVDQKLLFLKWIKPYFDINRHAMPIENAIKIKALLHSGQLKILGDADNIIYDDGLFLLKKEDGEVHEADYVINASGPAAMIDQMVDQPLLRYLLKKRYIEAYAAGGMRADMHNMRVLTSSRKKPSPFYVLGHQLSGMQLDVNSLWFNVEQADLLTDDLLRTHQ